MGIQSISKQFTVKFSFCLKPKIQFKCNPLHSSSVEAFSTLFLCSNNSLTFETLTYCCSACAVVRVQLES